MALIPNVRNQRIYEKIKRSLGEISVIIEEQTWLSYSLTEQHLKNKKITAHVQFLKDVVRLIQINN